MTASGLLNELRDLGVTVKLNRESLDVTAPKGVLTAAILEQIAAVKDEILSMLARPRSGSINRPWRVWSRQKIQCFFCDRGLTRKNDLYRCEFCNCFFIDMGPREV